MALFGIAIIALALVYMLRVKLVRNPSVRRKDHLLGFRIIPHTRNSYNGSEMDGDAMNISVLLAMDKNHEKFSGWGQDLTVFDLLGSIRDGYFIDLAARHPLETSNSRALERDLGWRGVCIEANERYHNKIAALRTCTAVAAIVADRYYPDIEYAMSKGAGGIVMKNASNVDPDGRLADRQGEKSSVKTEAAALSSILEAVSAPSKIDYMSLDVEGAEDLVLSSFPFDRYNITLMNIEGPFGKDSKASLVSLLRSKGYRWLCRSGGAGKDVDSLWAHESFQEPADFDPQSCLDNCRKALQTYQKYGFKQVVFRHCK